MNQIYTFVFLFMVGLTLPLSSQSEFQFDRQEDQVQSLVLLNNIHSNDINLNDKLDLQAWQSKSKKLTAGEAFLIWTEVGLASGFAFGTFAVLKDGPYEELSTGQSILLYGIGACVITLPIGAIIGLGHAISISSRQPKEKPTYLY